MAPAAGDNEDDGLALSGGGAAPRAALNADDASGPPASPAEIRSWLCCDFANSVYSTVGISGFLPLLLQSAALAAAGFPAACGNLVTNPAALDALFNATGEVPAMAHFLPDYAAPQCGTGGGPAPSVGGYVRGPPATPGACRLADGVTPQPLTLGGGVDPTSYATLSLAAATIVQVVAFLGLAAAADYGGYRRGLLLASAAVGGVLTLLCAGVTPSTWWLGAPLMVASNCAFGLNSIAVSAYLPVLVRALPGLPPAGGAPSAARLAAEADAANSLSGKGFAAGYAAGVAGILLTLPLALTLPELDAYRGALALTGVWWLVFSVPPAVWLRRRPGPPLPAGEGLVGASLRRTRDTLADVRALPATGWYLLAWMVGSDAMFAIGTLGGLYANSEVEWGCTPKGAGILGMFLLVPLAAGGGNLAYLAAQARWGWTPRGALVGSMVATSAVAGWGLLGFASPALGLRTGGEMLAMAGWYGLHIGAYQALSRGLFATLVPPGREGGMYALYELTNRGSSAVGPLVMTAIQATTGDLRWAFVFVGANILLPAWGLTRLDVEGGAAAARALGGKPALPAGDGDAAARGLGGGEGGEEAGGWDVSGLGPASGGRAADADARGGLRAGVDRTGAADRQ